MLRIARDAYVYLLNTARARMLLKEYHSDKASFMLSISQMLSDWGWNKGLTS